MHCFVVAGVRYCFENVELYVRQNNTSLQKENKKTMFIAHDSPICNIAKCLFVFFFFGRSDLAAH